MVWTPTEGEGGTPLPPVTTEQQNIVASNSIITCDSMGRGFIQHVIGKGGVYSIFLSRGGFCKKHAMCGGGVRFELACHKWQYLSCSTTAIVSPTHLTRDDTETLTPLI